MTTEKNKHIGWGQGYFVDSRQYSHWSTDEKKIANKQERLLVRPSPTGNAICNCFNEEDAAFIASRLNLAARLESKINSYLDRAEYKELKTIITQAEKTE